MKDREKISVKEINEMLVAYKQTPEWIAYQKMVRLTPMELEMVRAKWRDYYLKVRDAESYQRYLKQCKLWKQGDIQTVKDIAQEAREELIKNVPEKKPSSFDPDWLRGCWVVRSVERLEKRLKTLREDLSDSEFMETILNDK